MIVDRALAPQNAVAASSAADTRCFVSPGGSFDRGPGLVRPARGREPFGVRAMGMPWYRACADRAISPIGLTT